MLTKVIRSIRADMLVGLFLTVPVVVTVLIFDFLTKLATSWLPDNAFPRLNQVGSGYLLRALALLATLLVLWTVGVLMRNLLGRKLYRVGDKLLERIPLIRNIYVSVRQISQSLFTQRKTLFKEVVLVQYPRPGLFSIAFVTAVAPPNVAARLGPEAANSDCVSLFIPTTPNPTSGVFVLAPRSQITVLDVPVTDALTFVMSAGAVAPGEQSLVGTTLLDKLEAWLRHNDESSGGQP